jgi:hypothetical protein
LRKNSTFSGAVSLALIGACAAADLGAPGAAVDFFSAVAVDVLLTGEITLLFKR